MVTSGTLVKVPFDLAHWQKVAAEKYPHGLPKPFSSDPTQWLFNGHPQGCRPAVARGRGAVARLPVAAPDRFEFPGLPGARPGWAGEAGGCGRHRLPPVRARRGAGGGASAQAAAAAYGKDWKPTSELELVRATGSNASDLDEWLRNDFFAQHCELFHQRPFIWHIWDGRKRDGFHALVNYHKLAEGDGKGRQLLESLTYAYLGDWITRSGRCEARRGRR